MKRERGRRGWREVGKGGERERRERGRRGWREVGEDGEREEERER